MSFFSVKGSLLLGLCAAALGVDAGALRPRDVECFQYAAALPRDTCQTLASFWGLTLDQFKGLNPDVTTCPTLVAGKEYCVDGEFTPLPPVSSSTTLATSTTSKSSSSTKTTSTSTGLATPSPTQGGMVDGCTKFYFVKEEDNCASVLETNGLTLAQLFALNSGVKADCSGLWLKVYVCVAGPAGSSTTTSAVASTTSTSGNGIATPSPIQPPSIVPNCNKFYFVEPGTDCTKVLDVNGVTQAQLFAWNSGVKSDCSGMWASVWVCVGVIGGGQPSTTSKPTVSSTSTAANGIATPSPIQPPSIVPNCNKFYFVETGVGCSAVLSINGITEAQLFAWNEGVKSDCSGLWANVWVCVGVIGGSQPSSTSKPAVSSTSRGSNGIATPSPTQPPSIVSNCNKFYFVEKGVDCPAVLKNNGITQAQLFAWNEGVKSDCSGMWASVWLCVGVIGGPQPSLTTKTTSTTTRGNGVATPTPIQPGMVGNCKSFYQVVQNDNCEVIASKTRVSTDNLKKWNPEIGAACNVWLGYYLCIAVL